MKRLCAILLGLMMLAGLCACGRRTSPAPAPKTPEPVTVITPAQPTPSEAEVVPVSTPRRHHASDGGGSGLVRAAFLQRGPRLGPQPVSDLRL